MKPNDFVIRQTEGARWLSFPPLDAFPFILHGLTVKGQNPASDNAKKATGKLLGKVSRHEARVVSLVQMHRD